jgi:epoxyqueuosine reductase
MNESLQRWAETRGYRVAFGSLEIVSRARADIIARRESGELEEGFFAAELAEVADGGIGEAEGSVVVVARPSPALRVEFEAPGGRIDALLPPTYARYRASFEEVRQDIAANALPGAAVEHVVAPLKAVATRLGLARYGRNNVTYVDGFGSYLQLFGFVTDAPLADEIPESGFEPELLDECDGCTACSAACPTKAIAEDRVLLRAQRCITFANENPGPWPDWIPARSHNCILGCLLCQRACPANPRLPVESSGLVFSARETRALLDDHDASAGREANGIRVKLAWIGQPFSEPLLGRNLRALVTKRGVSG